MEILLCVIIIVLFLSIDSIDRFVNKTKIQSQIDGQLYFVSNKYDDKQDAANLLSKVNKTATELMRHLRRKYVWGNQGSLKRQAIAQQILDNYNPTVLIENVPLTPNNTSYVKNKGSEMGVCLREKESGKNNFHDLNTLKFVTIHELTHIGSKVYGHPLQFWINFKFMLEEAIEAGIYIPEHYQKNNIEYCGMTITYSPYYDDSLPSI